jgi:DNA-binding NtrC family response regulator
VIPNRACVNGLRKQHPFGIHGATALGVRENGNQEAILLVDDDVEVLKALRKVLEKDGFEVLPYSDAPSAMRFINDTRKRFDLVITDVSMPGMSGTAFLDAIKSAFPKVPVIIITAFGDWGQYMETIRSGACEYLNKPLDKAELLSAVRRALKTGTPEARV